MTSSLWDDDKPRKTVPVKLLRRQVWDRDRGICRVCGKPADQFDWELGHDRARSRGGKLTFKNTFVVHSSCNRSQQALTLKQVRRAIGSPDTEEERAKRILNTLTMKQLRYLALRHGIKLRAKVEENFLYRNVTPPTKRRYVNAIAKVVLPDQIHAELREIAS